MVAEKVAGLTNPMEIIPLAHSFVYRFPSGRAITKTDVAESHTDTAVYVLTRQAGECNDRRLEKGDFYITDIERENLEIVAREYAHTILVVHVGGYIELTFLDEISGIDAVVLFVQGGEEGGNALAFVKTQPLEPGASQKVELTFDLAEGARYDETASAWILDQGSYFVRIGNSAILVHQGSCWVT